MEAGHGSKGRVSSGPTASIALEAEFVDCDPCGLLIPYLHSPPQRMERLLTRLSVYNPLQPILNHVWISLWKSPSMAVPKRPSPRQTNNTATDANALAPRLAGLLHDNPIERNKELRAQARELVAQCMKAREESQQTTILCRQQCKQAEALLKDARALAARIDKLGR